MQIAKVYSAALRKPRDYPQLFGHNTHNNDDKAVNWRSRSFKVNDFFCNRKPEILLAINCHPSSISQREVENRTPPVKALRYFCVKTAWS